MLKLTLTFTVFPLALFALIAILNSFTFPRLSPRKTNQHGPTPRISVLIPMRNEARVIAETVRTLLAQDYPNFEVLLLDDHSDDGSATVARNAMQGSPHFKIVSGQELPTGWLGKNWACQQLAELAKGEILLFTDADVRWNPRAISALVAEMQATHADLLTVWPRQETISWSERLVVPLMNFSILAYLPALAVHHIPWPVFAAAIGQCLMFRRDAYQIVGGHRAIRSNITDDMAFAYAVKKQHLLLRMADGDGLLACRMYQNWSEVRNGYAKNILAGHGNSLAFLAFSIIFHWWIFVLPWLGLWMGLMTGRPIQSALVIILLGLLTRALSAAFSQQRLQDAILMPVSVILMTIIAAQAVFWRFMGGPQWKGRKLKS